MPKPGYTGLLRLRKATDYSWQGLQAAWRHESAFRQECTVSLLLLPLAFVVATSSLEVAALLGVLALVLITELLNSAIEAVVDRIGAEHHELAGRAKDMGSAAVFVSLLLAVGVWTTMCIENLY